MRVRKWVARILSMLFLASIVLWAASYLRFHYRTSSTLYNSQAGGVQILHVSTPWKQDCDMITYRRGWSYLGHRDFNTRWWVSLRTGAGYWMIYVPFWMPAVLFGASSLYVYRPYRRYKRRKRLGLCLSCGYNLTGNESGVCSECGTPTSPPASI
jgi:hypothetical protein